jgi:hypothetical protein
MPTITKSPRKKFVSNSRRKFHALLRRMVIERLKNIKMNVKPYSEEEDPYVRYLQSCSLGALVGTADYIMRSYPQVKGVDRIVDLVAEDLIKAELEEQEERR